MKMQVDDPPYLPVGTAVSAKYKGAFCEAKVSKVDRLVKCKVSYKSGLGGTTVSDSDIKGTLRVGQTVLLKQTENRHFVEVTITKIQDCSQYTVVFDDGDITTLRRTALCLKGGRHFNESETLDQLPLTHPEHFGIPVMGGRRGRRNRLLKDDSSDEELEEENEPDLEGYTQDIGRVVSVETGESKRGKEKWFPGLIVIPSAQPTVKINIKDEFLIRSFRDDRYYTVPKKEVSEFNRDLAEKIDSSGLVEAIQKAIKYLDSNELPQHWEKNSLFHVQPDSDTDDNASETSDEEQSEEKDRFVAQLYKFMDDSGTPLNKTPTVSTKDIDLHRLFRVVDKIGGYNRATNQNKWKSVAAKMRVPINQNVANQVKSVYKKCLLSYEGFFRTLGVTMSNPTRSTKKDRGRSLIRDKDRTPISSPRPDVVDEENSEKCVTPQPETSKKRKIEPTKESSSSSTSKKVKTESKDGSVSDVSDCPSTSSGSRQQKPILDVMKSTVKKVKTTEKPLLVDPVKKEEKVQYTRSKSLTNVKPSKEMVVTRQNKESKNLVKPKKEEDKKMLKPNRKSEPHQTANLGDKLIVYYGPTNESKVTYEAKVVDMDNDQTGPIYLVHYTGWNTRYDEWIPASRIAENLNSGIKSKRSSKVPAPVNVKQPSTSGVSKVAAKRSRLTSGGGKDDKVPRSTTPSSVTSSSSKSPATPSVRSSRLAAKRDSKLRRASAQTDLSVQSDLESESSESEPELSRTRSGSIKSEEVFKKKEKRLKKDKKDEGTDEEEGDAEDEEEEEDDEEATGRDFDLNQIRSELKGFSKALKANAEDPTVKTEPDDEEREKQPLEIETEKKEEKIEEESTSSSQLDEPGTSDDIYEFKEPEPFEFGLPTKLAGDEKNPKKRPRIFDSPRRAQSPGKVPEPPEVRTYSRVPKKTQISDEEEEEVEEEETPTNLDPFDKLIESPSFNLIKAEKAAAEAKSPPLPPPPPPPPPSSSVPQAVDVVPPETSDECSRDMELSDCESQTQIYTRDESLFGGTFSKSPNSSKTDEGKTTTSDDDDIQAQIQRVIAQSSSTDDDSEDATKDEEQKQMENEKDEDTKPIIDPALQETDSSLLESIVSKPPLILDPKLDDTGKELEVKTGTKIADSILQKFNFLKKNNTAPDKDEVVEPKKKTNKEEDKPEVAETSERRRRRAISKAIVEESDSDSNSSSSSGSSDSEHLVIGSEEENGEDDDSQTNSLEVKPNDPKKVDVKPDDDSQQVPEEKRNFSFDGVLTIGEDIKREEEPKEEVTLHSMLLCEEELPRSPASASTEQSIIGEVVVPVVVAVSTTTTTTTASVHEMPFASAPTNSSVKLLLEPKKLSALPPSALPVVVEPNPEAQAMIVENTPPTTPESTISNLSPRGDNGNGSPHSDNSKSTGEAEFSGTNPVKVSPYSEEDTQSAATRKSITDSFGPPLSYRKRRRSFRNSEDGTTTATVQKRGRKSKQQRRDSDSDEASESSIAGSCGGGATTGGNNTPVAGGSTTPSCYERSSRSPRPSKYNFFVEFDPSLDSSQRIAVLQQKLSEIRKTYADVKAELATVERRRKKLRRREREALKTAKQEIACA